MIKKGDERKECYKCKDCAMFADEMQTAHPIASPKTSTRSLWAKMRLVRSL